MAPRISGWDGNCSVAYMATDLTRTVGKLVFPDSPRPAILRYLVAVLLPLLSTAIVGYWFEINRAPFFVLFTMSVLLASIYGGFKAGLLATATSALINAILLPPAPSMAIANPEDIGRLAVFCLSAIVLAGFVGIIGSLQQKLENERGRLQVTLSSIGDAVIATDADGRITFLNPVAEAATGWTPKEAAGKPLEEVFRIVNESTRKTVENPVRKVFECGQIVGLANHTVLIRKDGSEIPIDDSAAPIRDVHGEIIGVVMVFRDVTEQRRSEAVLINAQKLASVGRLAATIAHEINNPLAAVTNLLFLAKSTEDPTQARSYLETAEQELRRASEITKQTLSFARREDKREQVGFARVIEEVLALHANKIKGKNVRVETRVVEQASVFASKSEIRQVLGNLVGNALDALAQDGVLHIRLKSISWGTQPSVRIVVADNGHGIARDHLRHIFEPFFTTKKDVGTGLGLWISRQIVSAHGGCAHVRSRVGSGTVMVVCWPSEMVQQVTTARA